MPGDVSCTDLGGNSVRGRPEHYLYHIHDRYYENNNSHCGHCITCICGHGEQEHGLGPGINTIHDSKCYVYGCECQAFSPEVKE